MDSARVDLLGVVGVLHEHLTDALCAQVFERQRVGERQRLWSLTTLAEFWTAVIVRAPSSLTQALQEAFRGSGGFPHVESTKQAFFAKAKGMRADFFRDLHSAFTERALEGHQPIFESDLRSQLSAFSEVVIADGSGLDRIAHRLKVLWDERGVVLPGALFVLYDLFRGVPRSFEFHPDAAGSELKRLAAKLETLPKDALVLGDRLYCSLRLFGELEIRGLWGLVRRKKLQRVRREELLSKQIVDGHLVEDLLVVVGTGQGTPRRTLRMIRLRKGSKSIELFTNVLDPARLPADVALRLYRRRWKIERMFYDLKVVLNLRRFYAANANAIAMQVYAAAMVYVAMRVAQARIAKSAEVPPERISTRKLFPRVAAASFAHVQCRLGYLATCQANPGVRLVEPDWSQQDFASAPLDQVLVEPRTGPHRRRRYCLARARHVSLHRFPAKKRSR